MSLLTRHGGIRPDKAPFRTTASTRLGTGHTITEDTRLGTGPTITEDTTPETVSPPLQEPSCPPDCNSSTCTRSSTCGPSTCTTASTCRSRVQHLWFQHPHQSQWQDLKMQQMQRPCLELPTFVGRLHVGIGAPVGMDNHQQSCHRSALACRSTRTTTNCLPTPCWHALSSKN